MSRKLTIAIGAITLVAAVLMNGTPVQAQPQDVKAGLMDESFTIAQTNGMERRGERRDTRQNCRQANGAVGADKRNCKQQGRQN